MYSSCEVKIDAAIDSILRASGSALKNYSMQSTIDKMRDAMREIMSESYISGSNEMKKIYEQGMSDINKMLDSCYGGTK